MKIKTVLLIIAACIIGLTTNADALTISVEDNIADNTYLSDGSTLNGQFDINPALPSNGDYVIPYDVSGAKSTFSFTDDGELNYDYRTTGSYRYDHGNYFAEYYYRYQYDYYYDEFEEVQVNMSGQVSSDGTDWYSMEQFDYKRYDGRSGYCGRFICYFDYFYTYNYDVESGYTGNITITQILDTDALADLAADGIIDFTIAATAGDIYYDSGTLTAEVNENPNPVPEPSTLLLLGSGMAGLAGFRKYRKRVSS